MSNYQTRGANHTYWTLEGDEPEYEEYGRIEEMYVDNGELHLSFASDQGLHDIRIPIRHSDGWVDFVRSLPVW